MKEKHILTKTEERRLIKAAEKDLQLLAMLRLVWNAGLTVAEAASLRWEDVDLEGNVLRVSGRTIPMAPEVQAALRQISGRKERSEWVFPSRRNEGPVARMSVNRELRRLLDIADLRELRPRDLRNLYILRAMEEMSLEEAVRVTGVEAVTLRDTWREHGRGTPPRPCHAGSVSPDDPALERALEKEGDTLDGRIIRLSWQGGLYLREIRALRWADISNDALRWTVRGETRPVPPVLRPWLAAWRDRGGEYVAAGPRSGKPLDETQLSRRTTIFFARYGLEGMSVAGLRGNGQVSEANLERILELVGRRGHAAQESVRAALELTPNQMCAAAAALRRDGRLAPEGGEILRLPGTRTPRERFFGMLEDREGETLTAAEMRAACGLYNTNFYYYIKEAEREGRLQKTGFGLYQVKERAR